MVSLAGLSGVAGGYEDVQKQQFQQMLEMMKMRQQMAADAPMRPEESPFFQGSSGPGISGPGMGPGQGPAGNFGGGGGSDPRNLIPYIREEAIKYGIDPDVAVRVARSEGLNQFTSGIPGEKSFGAFQLHTGGGMGDDFRRATGLDPADPKNERAGIDFALRNAARGGWGPFHGAANTGIGQWQGIGRGAPGPQVAMAGGGLPSGALPGGGQPPMPQNQPTGLSGLSGQAGQAAGAQGTGPGRLARDLPGEVASVQQPAPPPAAAAPPAGAPGGMMPRQTGLPSAEEYGQRLMRIPGMTPSRFSKLMDDYNKMYGPEQRAQAADDRVKIAEQRLAQAKEEAELNRKEKETLQKTAEAGKTERAETAFKGRKELMEERAQIAATAADKKEQVRREDVRQAQDFKKDEAERNEQRRRERMQIQVELKASPTMKDEAIDSTAKMALDGNFDGAMKAAGPGQAGAANRSAIVARMFEIGKEQGMSPEDLNNAVLGFHGRQEGIKSIARNEAKITAAASQVDAATNIVEQTLNDSITAGLLPTTRFQSINSFINTAREQLGDERLAAFQAALNDEKTAIARLYSGGNAVTVSGREETEKLFNRNMSPESIKAVLEIARQTSKSDVAAIKRGRESYTEKLTEPSLADQAAERSDDPAQRALNHAIASGASNSVLRDALIASGKTNDEAVAMLKTAQKAKEFAEKQQKAGAKDKMSSADLADVITKAAAQPTARQAAFSPTTGMSMLNKGIGRMFTPPGEFFKQLQTFLPRRGENPPPTDYGGVVQ